MPSTITWHGSWCTATFHDDNTARVSYLGHNHEPQEIEGSKPTQPAWYLEERIRSNKIGQKRIWKVECENVRISLYMWECYRIWRLKKNTMQNLRTWVVHWEKKKHDYLTSDRMNHKQQKYQLHLHLEEELLLVQGTCFPLSMPQPGNAQEKKIVTLLSIFRCTHDCNPNWVGSTE